MDNLMEVYVIFGDQSWTTTIPGSDTVHSLKEQISEHLDNKYGAKDLTVSTPENEAVKDSAKIYQCFPPLVRPRIHVSLTRSHDACNKLIVFKTFTGFIKQALEDATKIPVSDQVVLVNGEAMTDVLLTLAEYGVTDPSKCDLRCVKLSSIIPPEEDVVRLMTEKLRNKFRSGKIITVRTKAGVSLSAHQDVLCARSQVFELIFVTHDSLEKTSGEILLVDDSLNIDQAAVECFLDMIYTGKSVKLEEQAVAVLALSDKYAISDIKRSATTVLRQSVNIQNATDMLTLSQTYGSVDLKEYAIRFICKNKDLIMHSEKWTMWKKQNTDLALDVLTICAVGPGSPPRKALLPSN